MKTNTQEQEREELKIKTIMKDYGLTDDLIVFTRITHLLNLEDPVKNKHNFAISRNVNMFNNELLHRPHKLYPTGDKCLAALMLTYSRSVSVVDSNRILGTQAAGFMRDLKGMGFVFKKAKKDGDTNTPNNTFFHEGVSSRMINYYEEPLVDPDINCMKISPKVRKLMMTEAKCPFTGGTKYLEIDHRTPGQRCRQEGWKVATLIDEDYYNGTWKKYFQILSKGMNLKKKTACDKCQRGEDIDILPAYPRKAYKKKWEGTTCDGCFWHDYSEPQFPGFFKPEELKMPEVDQCLGEFDIQQEKSVKSLGDQSHHEADIFNI